MKNWHIQWQKSGTIRSPTTTDFLLWYFLTIGSNMSLFIQLGCFCTAVLSTWIIKTQLFVAFNIPICEQSESGQHRMHPDGQHDQIRLARVIDEPPNIAYIYGVHKSLGDPVHSSMLLHSDNIIHMKRSLRKLTATGFINPNDFPSIFTYKSATRKAL